MVNHVVLVGNLGSDPEVRTFGNQQKVTRLSVATHTIVRKRSGERERQTEWHQVVAWAALGERAAKHLRKGRNVLVEGRIQTRVWADARGNKHITAEIRADLPGGAERMYQGAVGYRAVLVNGSVAVRGDVRTNAAAGRFLRRV